MEKERFLWIDGLKGICCILIFVHHFICAFYTAFVFGLNYPAHTNFDKLISESVISVFINGNFLVFIFCTISGFVIARSFMKKGKKQDLLKVTLKRYLRLCIPVLLLGMIVWLLSSFKLFFHLEAAPLTGSSIWLGAYYLVKLSLKDILISALFKTPFYGDSYISNALWMYGNFLLGSIVIYFLCLVFDKKKKRDSLFLIVPLMACLINESFIACFISGYWLNFLVDDLKIDKIKWKPLLAFILIFVGLFLGGYPFGVMPDNYYHYLKFSNCFLPHFLAAVFLISGLYLAPFWQKFLSNKLFLWLGKLSFAIYLVHIPLIYSYSSYLFLRLIGNNRYNWDCLIVFIGTLCLLLLFSYLFYLLEAKVYKVVSQKILKEKLK